MRDLASAGDRQHDRAALQEPGERDLAGARLVLMRNRVQGRTRLRRCAGIERRPGDEADVILRAIVERRLAVAIDEVVAVLHRGDGEDLLGRLYVGDADFRQTRAADDLVLRRPLRIEAMQLPQIDDLDAEPPAARMRLLDQIFRPADRYPDVLTSAREAPLGRDMDLAIGRERFFDQLL